MPQIEQRVGQGPRALTGPQQRRHGITAGGRIDEPLEVVDQGTIGRRDRVSATPRLADSRVIRVGITGVVVAGLDLGNAAADHRAPRWVAAATSEIPPRPRDNASQAAQRRRALSWSNGASATYFCRTVEIIAELAIIIVYQNRDIWHTYFGPRAFGFRRRRTRLQKGSPNAISSRMWTDREQTTLERSQFHAYPRRCRRQV